MEKDNNKPETVEELRARKVEAQRLLAEERQRVARGLEERKRAEQRLKEKEAHVAKLLARKELQKEGKK